MAKAQPAVAPATGPRYWIVPVTRAALALIPAAAITFNRDHSASFGLVMFGSFALLGGLLLVVSAWGTLTQATGRTLFVVQGVVGAIAGGLALGFHGGGLGFFLYLVSVWAAVTGFLELYSGARVRGRTAAAKDWMTVGTLTAALALAFLLLPPNAVVAVGLFGAYLVLLGVYLVIAGLSLKWAATPGPSGADVATHTAASPAPAPASASTVDESDKL